MASLAVIAMVSAACGGTPAAGSSSPSATTSPTTNTGTELACAYFRSVDPRHAGAPLLNSPQRLEKAMEQVRSLARNAGDEAIYRDATAATSAAISRNAGALVKATDSLEADCTADGF